MCTRCVETGLGSLDPLTRSIDKTGGLPQSVDYLDGRAYLHNMEVVGHIPAAKGDYLNLVGCVYAIGERRYLLPEAHHKRVYDVTDPRDPVLVNENGAPGQAAFHEGIGKWVLMEPVEPYTSVIAHGDGPRTGKFGNPDLVKKFRDDDSFRGIRMWDISDPANFVLLSEFSTGDTGSGAHPDGCFWDGGKYAYLAVAPDDTFVNMLHGDVLLTQCLMVVDLSDPQNVTEVSRWWVPGQRAGELEAMKKWNIVAGRADDLPDETLSLEDTIEALHASGFGVPDIDGPGRSRTSITNLHGPVYVPQRVESGGTLGFGSWSALGFLIHDFSDIENPKLVGTFDPTPMYGGDGIGMHTIWLGTLSRGFVVTIPEAIKADGMESWLPSWVVDVRDPSRPTPIAQLPRPKPPAEAPYNDFTLARGRFGPHIPPHLTAPGRMRNDFLPIAYFNAGLRCYDLSVPTRPEECAYFIPPHVGDDRDVQSIYRLVDDVSIEWDRRLLYAGTTSGVWILSTPALGEPVLGPMPVTEWSLPGINEGAP